jgi:3-oxoacyl-[acyl-carrier-protein] synthase II
MTANDPDAAALRRMLRQVVNDRPIDLIHAHGTGTIFHDPVELAAFENQCAFNGSDRPAVYSHKGALGHSLGASGLVSIVLNCLMHRDSVVLPNTQTCRPLPTRRVAITRERVTRQIRRSLAVASGFGGSLGVVSLSLP